MKLIKNGLFSLIVFCTGINLIPSCEADQQNEAIPIDQLEPNALLNNSDRYISFWQSLLWDVASQNADFIPSLEGRSDSYFENIRSTQWGLEKIANCARQPLPLYPGLLPDTEPCTRESLSAIPYSLSYVHKGLTYQAWDVVYGPTYRYMTDGFHRMAGLVFAEAGPIVANAIYHGGTRLSKLTKGNWKKIFVGSAAKVAGKISGSAANAGTKFIGKVVFANVLKIASETLKSTVPGVLFTTQYLSVLATGNGVALAGGAAVSAYKVYDRFTLFEYLMEQIKPTNTGMLHQASFQTQYDYEYIKSTYYSELSTELFNQIILAKLEVEGIKADTTIEPDGKLHGSIDAHEYVKSVTVSQSEICQSLSKNCEALLDTASEHLLNSGKCKIIGFTDVSYDSHMTGSNSYLARFCPEPDFVLLSLPGHLNVSIPREDLDSTLMVLNRILNTKRVVAF